MLFVADGATGADIGAGVCEVAGVGVVLPTTAAVVGVLPGI